jgi:predicted DNA-binding transcriptional regulator
MIGHALSGGRWQLALGVGVPGESRESRKRMRFPRRKNWLRLCGLALALAAGGASRAADPPPVDGVGGEPGIAQDVRKAIAALDDKAFVTRSRAARRLQALIDEHRWEPFLAGQFARVLLSPDTSLEVRARIELLSRQLPPAPPTSEQVRPTAAEIAPLLDRLHSDASAERDSAERRLKAILSHVELIGPLWLELKCRAAEPALSSSSRRILEPLLDQAREAWLLAEPADVPLPAVSTEQIALWIDDLTRLDDTHPADRFRRALAEHELLDAIVRDDTQPRALQLLAESIAAAGDAASGTALRHIADFAKPAMAAEVWWNRAHITVQYLIVGVPQFNEMATRATHFDRIDETTAHCVSGNVLSEGNYPVRLAIPHPQGSEMMYHLTNLPTARRRLIYEFQVKREPALRLREISQRTLDHFLAQRTVLSETQVLMLGQLDPQLVSRFVGPYFYATPNEPLIAMTTELANQSTIHGAICQVMTRVGTHEAVPALEQLARSGRLGEPTFESPYRIAWIAALAIAQRDPWPEMDAWLAKLIDEEKPLMINGDHQPDLGASAAGLLLDRHGVSTRCFALEAAGENAADRFRFVGYRFTSDKDRQDVKQWWEKENKAEHRSADLAP